MRPVRRYWPALVVGFAGAFPQVALRAQQNDLHVAFVVAGESSSVDSARSKAFASFLRARFAEVSVHSADAGELQLGKADVVMLDWQQSDGVSKLFEDRSMKLRHPLGEREDWATPLVLLGSAGLNTSVPWKVRGGSG